MPPLLEPVTVTFLMMMSFQYGVVDVMACAPSVVGSVGRVG